MKNTKLFIANIILFAFALFNMANTDAQAVFSEDFEGVVSPALPIGWTKSSLATDSGWSTGDNTQTRIPPCSDATDYFPIPAHTIFALTNDDCCDCNKSSDYLNMPPVDLTGLFSQQLVFESYKRDNPSYQDSSYIEASVDSGITWTQIYSLKGFTVNVWKRIEVDLTAFDNTPNLRLRFHYDDLGGWGYGLCIDDVLIWEKPNYNISLNPVVKYFDAWLTPVYTQIPIKQTGTFIFSGVVLNTGKMMQTNVKLTTLVVHGADTVYNNSSLPVTQLPGQSDTLTLSPGFVPADIGSYVFYFSATSDSTDANPNDNMLSKSIIVTDNVFARDKGIPIYELNLASYSGVTGPGYQFANLFETLVNDTVYSISVWLGPKTVVGTGIQCLVYDNDNTSIEIGSTDFYTITASDINTGFLTLPITTPANGAPLSASGNYLGSIATYSSDTALTIQAHGGSGGGVSFLFDMGDNTWYTISAIPFVRMNLGSTPLYASIVSSVNTCSGYTGSASVNVTSGTPPYTYLWNDSLAQTTATANNLCKGAHTVTVTDFNGLIAIDSVTIVQVPLPVAAITPSGTVTSCGTAITLSASQGNSYLWSNGDTTQTISVSASGNYNVSLFNICGDSVASPATTVTINPLPATPIVTCIGDTCTSSSPVGNQWFVNNIVKPADTNQTFEVTGPTSSYSMTVQVTDSNDCKSLISNSVTVAHVSIYEINTDIRFSVYPNPNNGRFTLEMSDLKKRDLFVEIRDLIGQIIYTNQFGGASGEKMKVDLSDQNKGIYYLSITNSFGRVIKKLIIY